MGDFIPSPNDQLICDALNARFSDAPDPKAELANPVKTKIGSVRFQDHVQQKA
jgi:hypothetical protein